MWFWVKRLPPTEPLSVTVMGNGGRDSSDQHGASAPRWLVSSEQARGGVSCGLAILTARRWLPALTSIYLMGTRPLPRHGGSRDLALQPWAVTPTWATHACPHLLYLPCASGGIPGTRPMGSLDLRLCLGWGSGEDARASEAGRY